MFIGHFDVTPHYEWKGRMAILSGGFVNCTRCWGSMDFVSTRDLDSWMKSHMCGDGN